MTNLTGFQMDDIMIREWKKKELRKLHFNGALSLKTKTI
jgi:hypothetical protein